MTGEQVNELLKELKRFNDTFEKLLGEVIYYNDYKASRKE